MVAIFALARTIWLVTDTQRVLTFPAQPADRALAHGFTHPAGTKARSGTHARSETT